MSSDEGREEWRYSVSRTLVATWTVLDPSVPLCHPAIGVPSLRPAPTETPRARVGTGFVPNVSHLAPDMFDRKSVPLNGKPECRILLAPYFVKGARVGSSRIDDGVLRGDWSSLAGRRHSEAN